MNFSDERKIKLVYIVLSYVLVFIGGIALGCISLLTITEPFSERAWRAQLDAFVNEDDAYLTRSRILYEKSCELDPTISRKYSLAQQIEYCRKEVLHSHEKPGYYIHDFNLGRSIYLGERRRNRYENWGILEFPEILGTPIKTNNYLDKLMCADSAQPCCEFENKRLTCRIDGRQVWLPQYLQGSALDLKFHGFLSEYKLSKEEFFFPFLTIR